MACSSYNVFIASSTPTFRETHPEMAIPRDSSVVSKALQKNFVALIDSIKAADPQRVGDELFTEDIISQETLSEMQLPINTPLSKSRILVMSVRDKMNVVPDKLEVFMKILQKSIDEAAFQSKLPAYYSFYGLKHDSVY